MAKKSKKTNILEHLIYWGSITPREALDLYGSFRLAPVIFELKKEGHDIRTEMIKDGDLNYARYRLMTEPVQEGLRL